MALSYELFDFDYRGSFDLNGNMRRLYNKDALENALRMWFCSMKGEIVRLPDRGGYLFEMLYSPMKEEDVIVHSMRIRNGFNQDFQPYSVLNSLNIEPDFEKRTWNIDMEIFVPEFNYSLNFSVALQNQAA